MGEPDAGNPHVRFDEGGGQARLRDPPLLYRLKPEIFRDNGAHPRGVAIVSSLVENGNSPSAAAMETL